MSYSNSEQLHGLRDKIDAADSEIVSLICKRAELAHQIGMLKKQQQESAIYRPDREREVFQKLSQALKKNGATQLSFHALQRIYREIIATSIDIEGGAKIAYLGPPASFSHVALQSHFGNAAQAYPQKSIADVFRSVELNQGADYGVVPIDNINEGSIGATLDNLLRSELKIYAEFYIGVQHYLLFHKKTKLGSIQRLYSIPIGMEQCREWLQAHLNLHEIELIETSSTAAAAEQAAKNKNGAAIASRLAAETYNLQIIADNIQDNPNNATRFLVIGREQCAPSFDDKTSIVFSLLDRPGSLAQILDLFAKANINLTKIESRPNRRNFGEYNFFIDFLGHANESKTAAILSQIRQDSSLLKILGSYPRENIGDIK